MSGSTERRVPYDEVTIAFGCQQCGAETLINQADPRQRWEGGRALSCGVCGAGVESNLGTAVLSLVRAFRAAKESEQQSQPESKPQLHFRIQVD